MQTKTMIIQRWKLSNKRSRSVLTKKTIRWTYSSVGYSSLWALYRTRAPKNALSGYRQPLLRSSSKLFKGISPIKTSQSHAKVIKYNYEPVRANKLYSKNATEKICAASKTSSHWWSASFAAARRTVIWTIMARTSLNYSKRSKIHSIQHFHGANSISDNKNERGKINIDSAMRLAKKKRKKAKHKRLRRARIKRHSWKPCTRPFHVTKCLISMRSNKDWRWKTPITG